MDPRRVDAALLEAQQQAADRARAAMHLRQAATLELQRELELHYRIGVQREALLRRPRPRHPPLLIPWKPNDDCLQYPDDADGYGHEERAKVVCELLSECIWILRVNRQMPVFGEFVNRFTEFKSQTVPRSPQEVLITVDSAMVFITGRPYAWILIEAHDLDEGAEYFRCWRNRQALIGLEYEDGSPAPALTWEEISEKLLYEPLRSRCHDCPCKLGWGREEAESVEDMIETERQIEVERQIEAERQVEAEEQAVVEEQAEAEE